MEKINNLIVFKLDNKDYAVSYLQVERVLRSVEITTLPHVSDKILGIINIHGKVIPIINIRKIIDFPPKELMLSDKMVVITTAEGSMGFVVDEVIGLIEPKESDIVDMKKVMSDSDVYSGTVKTEENLIPIFNPDNLLSEAEKKTLLTAVDQHLTKTSNT